MKHKLTSRTHRKTHFESEPTCQSSVLRYWARITARELGYMNERKVMPFPVGGGPGVGRYTAKEAFAVIFVAECRRRNIWFREITIHLQRLLKTTSLFTTATGYIVITAGPQCGRRKPRLHLFQRGDDVISCIKGAKSGAVVIDLTDIARRTMHAMLSTNTKAAAGAMNPHGG